jgi:hypothetical protein
MKLLHWRPVATAGTMKGVVDIELEVVGLQVYEVIVHDGPNGPWAALPARPQIDKDGGARRNANGKIEYVRILKWRDRETTNKFSRAVIRLLLDHHPNALGGRQ